MSKDAMISDLVHETTDAALSAIKTELNKRSSNIGELAGQEIMETMYKLIAEIASNLLLHTFSQIVPIDTPENRHKFFEHFIVYFKEVCNAVAELKPEETQHILLSSR